MHHNLRNRGCLKRAGEPIALTYICALQDKRKWGDSEAIFRSLWFASSIWRNMVNKPFTQCKT